MQDIVNKFISYVAESEPSFADRIRGASPSEIDKLEKLVGTIFPEAYRSYLMYFGQNDGGLDLGQGATTNIERVYNFYEELFAEGNSPPPNCIVIAVEGVSVGDTSLEMRPPQEPKVVNTLDDKIQGLYADSLPCLLYRIGFMKYRARTFRHSATYVGTDTKYKLPLAREAALVIGFIPQWFSDSVCFCGELPQAMVVINQFQGRCVWVRISAADRVTVEDLGKAIAANIGVTFDRWWP